MNKMTDNYLLEFEQLKGNSIEFLLERIKNAKGKKLSELKIKDLSYHNQNLINPGEGVYIFRDKEKIILVGKVSSMSFVERIPKHLDYRPNAWFNRLLELICERLLEIEPNEENYIKASKYAFENLNLVLINFKTRDKINRIERLLRSCTETLNKFKNLKEYDLSKKLIEY